MRSSYSTVMDIRECKIVGMQSISFEEGCTNQIYQKIGLNCRCNHVTPEVLDCTSKKMHLDVRGGDQIVARAS